MLFFISIDGKCEIVDLRDLEEVKFHISKCTDRGNYLHKSKIINEYDVFDYYTDIIRDDIKVIHIPNVDQVSLYKQKVEEYKSNNKHKELEKKLYEDMQKFQKLESFELGFYDWETHARYLWQKTRDIPYLAEHEVSYIVYKLLRKLYDCRIVHYGREENKWYFLSKQERNNIKN